MPTLRDNCMRTSKSRACGPFCVNPVFHSAASTCFSVGRVHSKQTAHRAHRLHSKIQTF